MTPSAQRAQESRAGGASKWIVSRANAIPPAPPLPHGQSTSTLSLKDEARGMNGFQSHADAMCRPLAPVSSNKADSYVLSSNPELRVPKPPDRGDSRRVPAHVPENGRSGAELQQMGNPSGSGPVHLAIAGNEKLYEAYNELHSLAQEFHKPFDAPAILVVGHQTDGKSALVEALMGFQFNHVGGGTKTRRPITLHMKYNANCAQPRCFLISEDQPHREKEQSLEEIQAYIEAENKRLEREACQFSAKEIILKIEYKFCPNLTIIDTPGLISAAPGRKNQSLQSQGGAVEALVQLKMQQKEFIILCLEDSSDWSNATTRRVVMQADPELRRTVLVSTKLDTRIPQFARPDDVELFLKPPSCLLDGIILGGSPFFTSVPSGRVGSSKDSVFRSNTDFQEAVAARQIQDLALLEEKLNRPLTRDECSRIGISRLRWFLEQLLQCRYMDSVPDIVPILNKELRTITTKLRQTIQDLRELDESRLRERGRIFRDSFLAKLSLLLRGSVVAPPEKYGESLQDERVQGGAFVSPDGVQMPYKHVPNASMRLYGGAQYHRAMAEFRLIVGKLKCQTISREEIVNACGVEDIHDGTNYVRAACVIATSKAIDVFEPLLQQLGFRLSHILRRSLPIAFYLQQRDGDYLSSHAFFVGLIAKAFESFVESTERDCLGKCMEDLKSMTRYVTWSIHNKGRSALRHFLGSVATTADQSPTSNLTNIGLEGSPPFNRTISYKLDHKGRPENKATSPIHESSQTTHVKLVNLLESTLWNRKLAPTLEDIVNALVAQIFEGIRDHCVASAEMKFNCFFLMPMVDKFPAVLREELEIAFQENIDVFNVAQVRQGLEQERADLALQLKQVEKLHEKFISIHYQLSSSQPVPHPQQETGEGWSASPADTGPSV
ncbi:hypothetical protein M758_9G034900 [Ceratodon purpureus]|nr:hypothetical protein M758_9G034900 [Ceratodon purpureus]KAG0605140.1 hypothetical protein M758_9G034900 [Ceratodon purpureus]